MASIIDYTGLYKEYQAGLVRYAQWLCKDETIAKDIVQTVFLRLLERVNKQIIVNNWKAYLSVLVRNETISYLRKHKLHQKMLDIQLQAAQHFSNHEILLEKELRASLFAVIERLPRAQRLVYELRVEYNYKTRRTAEVLDLSPFTVKAHFQVVRRKIRKMVA